MTGIEYIKNERQRQIDKEGWGSDHDDGPGHECGEMTSAAIAYAVAAHDQANGLELPDGPPATWPWDDVWWKLSPDPIRNLTKAGALIAAEIDRLQRASQRKENDQRTSTGGTNE